MKGNTVADVDWRVIQFFLSEDGADEVEIDVASAALRCSCEMWVLRGSCKHTSFIKDRMKKNRSTYPVQISARATAEEAEEANLNSSAFRKFLIKYGKVEVL